MERDRLLTVLKELSDRGHGAAGFTPIFVIEQEILTEFDRLKEQLTELQGVCNRLMQDNTEQKEWLGKISEPVKAFLERNPGALGYGIDVVPFAPPKGKPKCEHKNGGTCYYSEGVLKQWCGDCKEWVDLPKQPLTQCPECRGGRGG